MKKKNWLLTIAFAVLALTIVSTTVLGGTYAKFVSRVSGGAEAQAAGFKVTAGGTGSIVASAEMIAPEVEISSSSTITYFSQVDTLIAVDTDNFGITFEGALANWGTIVSDYNTLHANDGYAVPAGLLATDVFKVTADNANSLEEGFLTALRAAATTANVALTTKTWTVGEGNEAVTYYAVKAMDANATTALTVTLNMGIEWANNYVTASAYVKDGAVVDSNTAGAVEVTAAEIIDEFDTYLGGLIYTSLQNETNNEPAPIKTYVTASIPVTATQNTSLTIDWTTGTQVVTPVQP